MRCGVQNSRQSFLPEKCLARPPSQPQCRQMLERNTIRRFKTRRWCTQCCRRFPVQPNDMYCVVIQLESTTLKLKYSCHIPLKTFFKPVLTVPDYPRGAQRQLWPARIQAPLAQISSQVAQCSHCKTTALAITHQNRSLKHLQIM
jgi:hypothetical protein